MRVLVHSAVILLVAGVVVVLAIGVGHTSLASAMPMTFLPGGAAGPAGRNGELPAQATSGGPGQSRGAPPQASTPGGETASPAGDLFTGRNAPLLDRELPTVLRYAGYMAGFTAGAALRLRVMRPRRRRSPTISSVTSATRRSSNRAA
jgi:hypothetical protein